MSDLLPERHRRRKQRERDGALRPSGVTDPFPALDGTPDPADYFRLQSVFQSGWYGVEPDTCLPVHDCIPDGDGVILELACDAGCRVRTGGAVIDAAEPVWTWPDQARSLLVPLSDGPLTETPLDPVLCFFRHPDEAGFWERITTDSLDATARLVYADWLDEHDDPHAGVFREPRPFRVGSYRLDWTGAMGRVNCGTPERRPTVWGFARTTGRDGAVPFTLSDDSPLPQFVAYLLGVTRIRADGRLSPDHRERLSDRTRLFGLSVMTDLILGPDGEPICRVSDPLLTTDLLDELAGRAGPISPENLAAWLRNVNAPVVGRTCQIADVDLVPGLTDAVYLGQEPEGGMYRFALSGSANVIALSAAGVAERVLGPGQAWPGLNRTRSISENSD